MVSKLRPVNEMLLIIGMLIMLPYAFYHLGHKVASYTIARECAVNNSFTEHGNEFYCQDLDDYRAK